MKKWFLLATALTAAAMFLLSCGDGENADGDDAFGPRPLGTVELSQLPPDGTVILVNREYYLMWQQEKIPIDVQETSLAELQQSGVTIGEPVPFEPLALAEPGVEPAQWVFVPPGEEGVGLYLAYEGEAHLVRPQILPTIVDFAIPEGQDTGIVDRVRLSGDVQPSP